MKSRNTLYLIPILLAFVCCSFPVTGQDGVSVFKQNCQACHRLGQRLVGPDLLGVNERRSEEWLISFIKSPAAMVKAGDPVATAMLEEYNGVMMSDQSGLSDADIKAVLTFIKEETAARGGVAETGAAKETPPAVPDEPVEYTEEDIELGRQLFSGQRRLTHGGPSCISCHNVNNNQLLTGGLLAKDLTNVYDRIGDAGTAGILGAPPFPAMAAAYKGQSLEDQEITQLTAFLKHASGISSTQQVKTGNAFFLYGGGGGLLVLFLLIALHWRHRLRTSVKHDIYKRQIKSL